MLHFCLISAEFPQIAFSFSRYLRSFRKNYACLYGICGTSASNMRICSMFAEFPQALFIFVCCLRNFRKYCSFLYFTCGTSANAMQFASRFIPSYSGVFLMGFNGFSGGDSCGGKGKTQCRLSASLALFRMVLSGPKSVSSTFAEMEMWRGACKKPTCGLPSGVLFLFGVDGLRDERL